MRFTIKNLRAIKRAETEDARITQILGGNQQGKTAVLNGIAAALLGKANIYDATTNRRETVVRHGEKSASVSVEFPEGGVASISWPGYAYQGLSMPGATDVTCGLIDPTRSMDANGFADFVRSILGDKVKITRGMLKRELMNLPGATIELVDESMKLIADGWDAGLAMAKAEALTARRAWEKETGEKFGEKKALTWMAEGYNDEDGAGPLESEIERLTKLKVRADIIEQAAVADLKTLRKKLVAIDDKIALEQHGVDSHKKLAATLEKQLAPYPDHQPAHCPHCSEPIVPRPDGSVIKVQANFAWRSETHKKLMAEADECGHKLAGYFSALENARTERKTVYGLVQKLEKLKADEDERSSEELAGLIEDYKRRLNAVQRTWNAGEHFAAYSYHDGVYQVLRPTGLRLRAMRSGLAHLQEGIDKIAGYLFEGDRVELRLDDEELMVYINDESYQSLSWNGAHNSIVVRIRTMFQLYQASIIGGGVPVLIDEADTLERRYLAGLMRYLKDHDTVAVIARTVSDRPERDLLAKQGIGRTYWLEDGRLEPV